jgi:putative heme degradation protein
VAQALRIAPEWPDLLSGMKNIGEARFITAGAVAALESTGEITSVEVNEQAGLLIGRAFDVRCALPSWTSAEVLRDAAGCVSIRVTGPDEAALFRLECTGDTDCEALALALRGLVTDQPLSSLPSRTETKEPPGRGERIKLADLRRVWDSMTDVAELSEVLEFFDLTRADVFRLVGGSRARKLPLGEIARILRDAAGAELPLVLTVANAVVRHTCIGPLSNVDGSSHSLVASSSHFRARLHLDPKSVSAWLVRYSTAEGAVSGVEICDAAGDGVASMFAKDARENPRWKQILEDRAGPRSGVRKLG